MPIADCRCRLPIADARCRRPPAALPSPYPYPIPLIHYRHDTTVALSTNMNYAEDVEASTIAEMEETIARISSHKGVEGVMIMDRQGMMTIIIC